MENTKKLSFDEVIGVIKNLASSQGFYGRLLQSINEAEEWQIEELKKEWDGKFTDAVDFILYIEC